MVVEKTEIEPLKAVDHAAISYPAFRKQFYTEHPDVAALSWFDVCSRSLLPVLSIDGLALSLSCHSCNP